MYATADDLTRALIQIPVVLYTVEQVFVGQFMIWYFRRWLAKDKVKRDAEEAAKASGVVESVEDKEIEREERIAADVTGGGLGGADGTAGAIGTSFTSTPLGMASEKRRQDRAV